jgi:hypothetical protein
MDRCFSPPSGDQENGGDALQTTRQFRSRPRPCIGNVGSVRGTTQRHDRDHPAEVPGRQRLYHSISFTGGRMLSCVGQQHVLRTLDGQVVVNMTATQEVCDKTGYSAGHSGACGSSHGPPWLRALRSRGKDGAVLFQGCLQQHQQLVRTRAPAGRTASTTAVAIRRRSHYRHEREKPQTCTGSRFSWRRRPPQWSSPAARSAWVFYLLPTTKINGRQPERRLFHQCCQPDPTARQCQLCNIAATSPSNATCKNDRATERRGMPSAAAGA